MLKLYIGSIKKLIKVTKFDNILRENEERNKKRKDEKRAGEILLLEALSKENIIVTKPLVYEYKGTKPYLKDYLYYFNISHSSDYIVLVISDQEVGVDIEKIKKRARKLAHNIVSLEEMSSFLEISEKEYECSVIKIWTIKEAFLKYLGTGLIRSLPNVKIDDYSVKLNDDLAEYISFQHDNFYITIVAKSVKNYERIFLN